MICEKCWEKAGIETIGTNEKQHDVYERVLREADKNGETGFCEDCNKKVHHEKYSKNLNTCCECGQFTKP